MNTSNFLKAGMLALGIAAIFIAGYEWHWRSHGFPISYNDDEPLWSDKRAMVYEPKDKATVFIGSSRIKFDLNIPLWEQLTGDHAIQLAMVGSSPRQVLTDLANDKNFKGKLIVDVTEGLFFSAPGRPDKTPLENIAFYKKRTPAQKASFVLNHGLESKFVFLQTNLFSLNALLDKVTTHDRKGVYGGPKFPPKFSFVDFNRQTTMSHAFLTDTAMQRQVTNIWMGGGLLRKPIRYDSITLILNDVKDCVTKIKARGGQVLFVRTPSSGMALKSENENYPRAQYWDRLLAVTGCPGIHFEDYPEMAHFTCPEWSHLAPKDRIAFTKSFVQALKQKGWTFSNSHVML